MTTCRAPYKILKYYKTTNYPDSDFRKEIVVGDFILSMRNVRICLMFESEIDQI